MPAAILRRADPAQTGRVAAKPVAAAWARDALAPQWTDAIDAALAERPDAACKAQPHADPEAFRRTLAFFEVVRREAARSLG